jgi:hypothetical protein
MMELAREIGDYTAGVHVLRFGLEGREGSRGGLEVRCF